MGCSSWLRNDHKQDSNLDEDATGFDLSVSAELSGANVFLTYVAADATIEGGAEQNNDLSLGATMMNDYLFGEYRSKVMLVTLMLQLQSQLVLVKQWQ